MAPPRNVRNDTARRRRGADGRADHPLLEVRLQPWRSRLLLGVFFVAFSGLAVRAFVLQGGVNTEFLQEQGERRYARTVEMPATRGKVTDRNGVVLASSLPTRAVWAFPDKVRADPEQLRQLAGLLKMPLPELQQRLAEPRPFTYLRRQLDPAVAEKAVALMIPGVGTNREFRRHYPEGPVSAHVVGFTGQDDRGQEGIELAYEQLLAGRPGSRRVILDRLRRVVEDDWLREPLDGRDLRLSIDHRVQYIAHAALRSAVETNAARAGAIVVLDVPTGEVLALANWPSFDPNARHGLDPAALRNRALTDMFEPGSTMKPFSIAAALEAGKVTPHTVIQTAPGWMTIGDRRISDTRAHGLLTVEQVVAQSSNVGTAKIVLDLPAQSMHDLYTAVGFGQAPRVGFPGEVAGRLRPAKAWRPIEQATIGYGYGVSVSLMQLAHAYLALARDGDAIPVSLMHADEPRPAGVRAMKVETARAVRHMLELAVSDEGTAPAARFAGYRVAGKTGTARKFQGNHYLNAYVASFAGFAPESDPRIVVAVMIDEPAAGRIYGGDVAAPVFAQVAASALRTLQVPPDQPQMTAAADPRGIAR
jgi:cell division protein FtsI (penicillin-binding protein 3)